MTRRRVKPLPYDPPPLSTEDLVSLLGEPEPDSAPTKSSEEDKPHSDEAAVVAPKPQR